MRIHRFALKSLAIVGLLAGAALFMADGSSTPAPASPQQQSAPASYDVGEAPDSLEGIDVSLADFAHWVEGYSWLQAVAQAQAARAAEEAAQAAARSPVASAATSGAIPSAWVPTAICEEGGRNDPYAGYFGILEWNHFDGYPTAGSAPMGVQLAWEAAHGQGPPDAPGQCHGY